MPDHDERSQSTFEGDTQNTGESSNSAVGSLADRLSTCEKLVEDALNQGLSALALADSLKEFGLNAAEAIDYIDEFNQRLAIRQSKAKQRASPPADPAAAPSDRVPDQQERDRAVDEAAWASLRAKLDSAGPVASPVLSASVLDRVFELLGQEGSSSAPLSKSVLAVAPHLADDGDSVFEDSHLNETQKCKIAYANQKPFENLVIKAQGRRICEPVANSIWRLVILDKYVDFEKLYVTLDPDYNPNDEAKELNEKFTLLEKHSISSRRPVLSEAEWLRLYEVWAGAVLHFYVHRKDELSSYRELIINMFRASSSPLPAIKYDRDSRERYSRQPYRLDCCKDILPFPLLSQLLSSIPLVPSSSSGGKRRRSGSQEGPRKRAETVCQNWNLGSCDGDTCHYGRKHNVCSECNSSHRARDKPECLASLTLRRQQQKTAGKGGGRS